MTVQSVINKNTSCTVSDTYNYARTLRPLDEFTTVIFVAGFVRVDFVFSSMFRPVSYDVYVL